MPATTSVCCLDDDTWQINHDVKRFDPIQAATVLMSTLSGTRTSLSLVEDSCCVSTRDGMRLEFGADGLKLNGTDRHSREGKRHISPMSL